MLVFLLSLIACSLFANCEMYAGPASGLKTVVVGALDRALTIRIKTKSTLESERLLISGNIESLGNWMSSREMQAKDRKTWEFTFSAKRSELGLMNSVVFKIAAISRSGSVQIPNIEDKIESLSFIRHSTSTFLDPKQTDCKMNRNLQQKLIQYARRLNDGRLDWELSRKRIERLQEKMVRNAMIAGLCWAAKAA